MDTPLDLKSKTYNGKRYVPEPAHIPGDCSGCAGRNNMTLCRQLSDCAADDIVWVVAEPAAPPAPPPAAEPERLTPEEYMARIGSDTNAIQIGGDHYKSKGIQPWDYIAANDLDYFQGNVVKYVTRFREKNGIQDLEKAQHYLQKLIDIEKAKQ